MDSYKLSVINDMLIISSQIIENKRRHEKKFWQISQVSHSLLLKRRTRSLVGGRVLPVEALPRGEDLRAEGGHHSRNLGSGIAVNLHSNRAGDLHHLRYELLHRWTFKVGGNGGLVGVALDQAATRLIGAEHKVVTQGAGFLLADRCHLFCDCLKLGQFAFVNIDIDQQAYASRAHGCLVSLG